MGGTGRIHNCATGTSSLRTLGVLSGVLWGYSRAYGWVSAVKRLPSSHGSASISAYAVALASRRTIVATASGQGTEGANIRAKGTGTHEYGYGLP